MYSKTNEHQYGIPYGGNISHVESGEAAARVRGAPPVMLNVEVEEPVSIGDGE
jgi:hypothetical protein